MTILSLGALSVGGAVPGASVAVSAGIAGINGALPDIAARLTALAAFAPSPVSFTAQIALASASLVSVNAAITAGLPVPDIAVQLATVAAVVADLAAAVAAVNAQLSVLAALQAPLAVGGVAAYAYDGAIGSLGSELGAAVGGGGTHSNALALVTTDPTAWAAMSAVLKVTP
jgi:hypothetical protein